MSVEKKEKTIEPTPIYLKEFWSPKELESEHNISTSTQAKLRMNKTIPYHKIGKYVRYKRADINKWFDEAKVV